MGKADIFLWAVCRLAKEIIRTGILPSVGIILWSNREIGVTWSHVRSHNKARRTCSESIQPLMNLNFARQTNYSFWRCLIQWHHSPLCRCDWQLCFYLFLSCFIFFINNSMWPTYLILPPPISPHNHHPVELGWEKETGPNIPSQLSRLWQY